jgi:RNA 2',3'-cyclic 3'-phosphodiesterase
VTNPRDIRSAAGTGGDARPTAGPQSRIFVGLKMAPEIARKLALLAQCVEPSPRRLVPADDIHLTLVPPWSDASIPDAVAKLRETLEGLGGFSLTFARLCYGPEPRRPRMLWAECAPNAEIVALRNALLSAFGQESDRPFRPHVTLARIGITGRAAAEKNPVDKALCLTQPVNSVELFRSPTPGESGCEVVASLPLKHVVSTRG